jgi:hypothetical protein
MTTCWGGVLMDVVGKLDKDIQRSVFGAKPTGEIKEKREKKNK